MLELFNNNTHNLKYRRSNSDLMNIKDEYTNLKTAMSSNAFNTGISNSVTINEFFKTSQKKLNNIKVMNLSEKKSRNVIKINKPKHIKLSNEKDSPEIKEENKIDSLNQKLVFFQTAIDNIPNINIFPKKQKQKNNFKKSLSNNIIYYNSTMKNFYKTQNEIDFPLNKKINSVTSNEINFVHNILTFYKLNKRSKSYKSKITIPKINSNKSAREENKENEIMNKLLKGFSFVSGNKSTLKVLFHRIPIKIKPCLQSFKKIGQPEAILNPITNSYGVVLDDVSEKIGFMKDSINMIYPRISKARYKIKEAIKYNLIRRNRSLIDDNLTQNNCQNTIYKINKRKINIQTIYSKYPIDSRKKSTGEHLLPFAMYSLRRKK